VDVRQAFLSVEPKTMTGFRSLFVATITLAAMTASPGGARAADASLQTAFGRLDKAAASFKGLAADMKRVQHTELVNANETDEGVITVKKYKANDTRILISFMKPDEKFISVDGSKAMMFTPKTKEAQEVDIHKHRDLVNAFMRLGFGSTSAELQNDYTVEPGGPETVNGTPTIRIGLIPKSEEIRHHVKKAELWIREDGIPVQQKFHQSGGDYQLTTYTNVMLKSNIPDSAVKLDLPKGVKVVPYR
jgi:outer membrane lipoprotein-sorting protein